MACRFFMSYAHADDQPAEAGYVRTFFDGLTQAVLSRVEDQSPPVSYLDGANLQPGDSWPDEIAIALRQCRTFIPIMTARYFTRPYCGREWSLFEDRCRSLGLPKLPPLIIPILWVPPEEGTLPEYATDLQFTFDRDTFQEEDRNKYDDYLKYGLLYVIKRMDGSHQSVYDTMLTLLAKRIIAVAKEYRLDPLVGSLPSLKEAPNRFESAIASAATAATRANFAFIAARRNDMQGLRAHSDRIYGAASEQDWMPYWPSEAKPIALIAQSAALENQLVVNWVPNGSQLVTALEQAETDNSVAIVVIDPWAARLPKYRDLLEQFDRFQFRNCVVLIPWNKSESETQSQLALLSTALEKALWRNFKGRKDFFFRQDIKDRAGLHGEMVKAIADLEALLAPFRSPVREAGDSSYKELPVMSASAARSQPTGRG